jgi:Tol biopolymer transport system component
LAAAAFAALAIADLGGSAAATTARAPGYWLVVGSTRDGNARAYSVRPDGSRLTLLVPRRGIVPTAISQDGMTVAYNADAGIYISRANGTGLRLLTVEGVAEALSRDGKLLSVRREGIWIVRTDGSGLRRVTSRRDDEESEWAPDGKALVLADWSGHPKVVVHPLRGPERVLARGSYLPKWSPDGRWIAYVTNSEGSPRIGLYVVRPNGTGKRRVAREAIYQYAWAPDGRRLAYAVGFAPNVVVVDLDGRVLRRMHLRGVSSIGALGWSPDSRLLAAQSGITGATEIWVVGADGRGLRRVTNDASSRLVGWTRLAPVRAPVGPLLPSERVVDARAVATRAAITDLSADGVRVALAVATRTAVDCDHVVVWTPANRGLRRFGRPARCQPYNNAGEIYDVELAGFRAAWASNESCGNYCDVGLRSATLGETRPVTLSYLTGVVRSGDPPWDHYLRGHGDLLVFDDGSARLVRIGSGRDACAERGETTTSICTSIRRGTHACCADSVADGLIAIHELDAVAVLDSKGALVRAFPFGRGQVGAARIDAGHLVVARSRVLEVYDVQSGAAELQRPLPSGFQLADVDGGIAVLRNGTTVMLLRLADGRSLTLKPGREPVSAELESAGLYYAYATADGGGRAVFVPRAEVERRLGGSES